MYENIIDPQIQILQRSLSAWENAMPSLPDDLSPYVPYLNKNAVRKMFVILIERLERIKLQSEEDISPFVIQNIGQNFNSWTAPLEPWIASGVGNVSSIFSHLNTMWSQLNAFDSEIKLPSVDNIQKIVLDIQEAKSNALKVVKDISDKVPEFEGKRDQVLGQCDSVLNKAKESLEASARAGLAVSFSNQAKVYDKPRNLWLTTFVLALLAMVLMALCKTLPDIQEKNGIERLYVFITDIPLVLPFVWLAWFSALRFSQLGRFKEDYNFKVATALALDGYRRQAEGMSPQLEEKLLDLAITNFGENPLRLMTKDSAKDAHPLAGAFDDKTIAEIIKALSDKVRK